MQRCTSACLGYEIASKSFLMLFRARWYEWWEWLCPERYQHPPKWSSQYLFQIVPSSLIKRVDYPPVRTTPFLQSPQLGFAVNGIFQSGTRREYQFQVDAEKTAHEGGHSQQQRVDQVNDELIVHLTLKEHGNQFERWWQLE